MIELKNAAAGAVLGGSLLFTAGLTMANAQPEEPPAPESDGLVTVLVGGSTTQDSVPVEEAAAAAAGACGSDPAAAVGLAQLADVEGAAQTVCPDVLIVQNTTEPVQAPADGAVESEAPAVPGGEEAAPEEEGSQAPAVPGEGEADIPFNAEG
ncbi:hypothetical protein [Mycolicibacterium pyrenivorans]|uniref:hypothetical protein n=1 Tax=Mycolicibacterium pyrenivorans TaxID=187102 RepID=UPI0021F3AF6D|nr:hypothetical protein [Mycolicibacterium pyrenivorans]MCV7150414.1 hypothetical protein [Mycolicibacterium pyrenivorans]